VGDPAPSRPVAGSRRALAAVLLVALVVRLAALGLVYDTPPAGDERGYLERASELAEGRAADTLTKRPPGASVWGALWIRLAGGGPVAVRIGNLVAGVAVAGLALALGRRVAGEVAGRVAGLLVALYPALVFQDVSLWSESLYGALALGGLVLAIDAVRGAGVRAAVGAGVLLGLATLTREVGALVVVAVVLWAAGRRSSSALRPSLILALAAVVCVLPWSVVVSAREGSPVLVSRTGGQNLFLGNWRFDDPAREASPAAGPAKRARYERLGATQGEREREASRLAWAAIRERQPEWVLEKCMSEIPDLLVIEPLAASRLRADPEAAGWEKRWAYRRPSARPVRLALAGTTTAAWVLLGAAGLAGLVLAAGLRERPLLWLWIGAHVLPVIVAFGISRFRLPLVPVLAVAAAALAVEPRAAWAAAGTGRRGAAALALLLFAVILYAGRGVLERPGFG
jgi:4-amino-4-deoxy-L-arabinose transferase-like glycosyltransferase